MKRIIAIGSLLVLSVVLIGASQKERASDKASAQTQSVQRGTADVPDMAPVVKPAANAQEPTIPASTSTRSAAFQLNWYSINGGGVTNATSTNYQAGVSVGQSVAGSASGTNYQVGIGFWYGASGGGGSCPIALSGDVNVTGNINSADIIVLVNYVFKSGADPQPCAANGDVNCSGNVNSADIIRLVNYVFKSDIPPCDICTDPNAQPCV